ncbi:MAG TPA: methyltransferase domain-containing protein [Vicinamibacterales bacterium]|nr:methyltransferase domain-containing protein [Vicinamibacterales bacterium]
MSSTGVGNPQTWNADGYARNAAFVAALGAPLIDRLNPQSGERILDVGCGDGTLTEQIAARGAAVVGIDASEDMIAAARKRGLDVHVMDAQQLPFVDEFDAAFSNAVLHWIPDADAVIAGVHRALKRGGRFVGEFGGHSNVAAIMTALRAVLPKYGIASPSGWYYPTPREYGARLEKHGFTVDDIALVPRPTPLPTGMAGWLETFRGTILNQLAPDARQRAKDELIELLRPSLCDEEGNWTADYVRLRFSARRNGL